jgi:hypothetical protein
MKLWRWNSKFRRDERVQPTVGDSIIKPIAAIAERSTPRHVIVATPLVKHFGQPVAYAMTLAWAEWDGQWSLGLA